MSGRPLGWCKGEKNTDINDWSLAAVHLTACVSLSSSCPLMPTPGQREAGRVVTVRAAVNQTPSTCQQQPHRCSKMEWVSQSHTESGWLMARLGDSSALINWVIDGKVWEIKRRERQNTNPCGGVEMWDILRGADWNAHSCLSCTEIPGFSQSCPLKTKCWAPGLVGTLFSSFNTPFKHRLSSRELFSLRLLFSFQNEVQCSLHPVMTETACSGRQWEWREKLKEMIKRTIGQKKFK